MKEIESIQVNYHGRHVGTIAKTREGKGAFQYAKSWLAEGFSLSPFSLPDGWGRLLVDRLLLARKIPPGTVGAVERLGIVGRGGMGALEYVPELFSMDRKLWIVKFPSSYDRKSIGREGYLYVKCAKACSVHGTGDQGDCRGATG
ncbi:MAG: hypothetical protein HFG69_15450 [Hungatella sp.]|nr:hypothetical protein [Hungatella sp.]